MYKPSTNIQDIPMIMTALKGKGLLTHCSADCVPEKGHTNTFFWIFVFVKKSIEIESI